MSASPTAPRRWGLILAMACSSAAALIFEIALTRIFAVTQFYHFAFMAVSLALLGYGASGSLLTVFPVLAQPRYWAIFAFAQSLAALGAYLLSNALPLDSNSIAWDALLRIRSHHAYAANLIGSGAGCDDHDPISVYTCWQGGRRLT